ncbi:MAG: CRISPR-associated endonuclease Cas6 [Bacteroides sp.]|nr:CRISPR-associated endonuclease Cas6 [Bacteroides sp.]
MIIQFIIVTFEEHIAPVELPWFRGAIIELAGNNPLFHNHLNQGYNYRYPKIQYKIINDRPAILGVNEGADSLRQLLSATTPFHFRLGHVFKEFHVASVGEWSEEVSITPDLHNYRIENWLPLNARNYNEYLNSGSMAERIFMLDRILTGNILSFAKGMGIFFDSQVICRFEDLKSRGNLSYKGIDLLSFSGTFKSNVLLPQWIGLGKSASLNHGIITQI